MLATAQFYLLARWLCVARGLHHCDGHAITRFRNRYGPPPNRLHQILGSAKQCLLRSLAAQAELILPVMVIQEAAGPPQSEDDVFSRLLARHAQA